MELLARLLDGSRMSRETHVRFCEGLGVKFPRSTLQAFRILKSCLHLGSCQQHSMQAQALFILLCCVAFACLELVPDLSPYAVKQAVISGKLSPESLLKPELIKW